MGMPSSLKPYLKEFSGNDPVSAEGLRAFQDAMEAKAPAELIKFLKFSNGGEVSLGDAMIQIYSAEEIPGIDAEYRISEKTPGLIPFATDEGDGVFVFDTRYQPPQIVRTLFSSSDKPEESTFYGAELATMFKHLAAGTQETTIPVLAAKAKPKAAKAAKATKNLTGPGEVFKFKPKDINGNRDIQVASLSFSPDGSRAVSHHYSNPMSHWDLATGKEIAIPGEQPFWHGDVSAFAPDGRHVYVAGGDSLYKKVDLQTGQVVMENLITDDPRIVGLSCCRTQSRIYQIVVSPLGKYLYTGSTGVSLVVDAETLTLVRQLPGSLNKSPLAAFAKDEPWIALGYPDFEGMDRYRGVKGIKQDFIRLFSLPSGECIRTIPSVNRPSWISLSNDGRLAGAFWDKVVVYRAQTGETLVEIPTPVVGAVSCAFTPDDTKLVVGTSVGKMLVFDAAKYTLLHETKGPSNSMNILAVSPDSHYALTGGEKTGMIRYWRIG